MKEMRTPGEYPRKKQRKELEDLHNNSDPCKCKCLSKLEVAKVMEEREKTAYRNESQRKQFLYDYLKNQTLEDAVNDDVEWRFNNHIICCRAFFKIYAIKKDR